MKLFLKHLKHLLQEKCTWTKFVLPFHGHATFKEELSHLYVTIPKKIFFQFCNKDAATPNQFQFELKYEIL
jgi:hypothetical protein